MDHQQTNKQKVYSCPLTHNKIVECNVSTCMYHGNYKANCALLSGVNNEYVLAEDRGLSISETDKYIRSVKDRISKIIILDNYIDYVKSKPELKGVDASKKYLKELYQEGWVKRVQKCSPKLFAKLCSQDNFDLFIQESGAKKVKLSQILNVRESKLKHLN